MDIEHCILDYKLFIFNIEKLDCTDDDILENFMLNDNMEILQNYDKCIPHFKIGLWKLIENNKLWNYKYDILFGTLVSLFIQNKLTIEQQLKLWNLGTLFNYYYKHQIKNKTIIHCLPLFYNETTYTSLQAHQSTIHYI